MTLVFQGLLTEAQHKSHIPVHFTVPPGTTRITGTFTASPARARGAFYDNLISLSLFGPDGARGARHNHADRDFSLDAAHATPGYLPGAIAPGDWVLFMDTFRLIGPDPVAWRLQITLGTDPVAPPAPPLATPPLATPPPAPRDPMPGGRGWYRGDLHAHSWHSDGSWDILDLVGWAMARGLDFVTLTDHNTVSGHAQMLALGNDRLLTMAGAELTTHRGHALTLGRRDWQEWRTGPVSGKTMPGLARAVMAKGALFVIAHPMAPGDPGCTGCRWGFDDMMPGPARIVEIWNGGPWSPYNEEGLALYRRWLGEGHRLVATAGSDIHGPEGADLATGFNHVHAAARSEAAILAAVALGRNYLSSGPELILTAQRKDGPPAPMGSRVGRPAWAFADWTTGAVPLELIFTGPGGALMSLPLAPRAQGRACLPEMPQGFVMAELRDDAGVLHAVTNPVFVD